MISEYLRAQQDFPDLSSRGVCNVPTSHQPQRDALVQATVLFCLDNRNRLRTIFLLLSQSFTIKRSPFPTFIQRGPVRA